MRRWMVMISMGLSLIGATAVAPAARAQDGPSGIAPQGPRFLLASPSALVPVDVQRMPVLGKRLALDLEGVTLREALTAISTRSGLDLLYHDAVVPLNRRVHLKADAITVYAALSDVLFGLGVDVVLNRDGGASIVRQGKSLRADSGVVVGRVTDAKTGDGIGGAEVFVEGTRVRAPTNDRGMYRLINVPAGRVTLAVRRVGYTKRTMPVTVAGSQEVTVDVALQPMATQLDELVTTVTGDRRARELGHVIGRINADSIVKEAPVSTISELLTGRIPGVQVFQSSGIVGGDVQIKIRTPNSLMLNTQPIVIVDGVRYTSAPALDWLRQQGANIYNPNATSAFTTTAASQVEPTSPLNDLNPNDLESIEIVKGPTAATLYGTDAANGVIVITTKRGRPGPVRWTTYVRTGLNENPGSTYPKRYQAYGTHPSGAIVGCSLDGVASGFCTQDSIVEFKVAVDGAAGDFLTTTPSLQYGVALSGGTQALRYYITGSFDRETGPFRMPPTLKDSIEAARGEPLPEEQAFPNANRNANLRANLTATFSRFTLDGSLGYVRRTSRTLLPFGNPYNDRRRISNPANSFSLTSTEQVDRVMFSGSGRWQALPWLTANASAGTDVTSGLRHSLERRGETVYYGSPGSGSVQDARTQQRALTANLGVTAELRRGRVSSRTSIGAQFVRSLNDIGLAGGTDLVPGGESVPQAANRSADQLFSQTNTLGSYLEETLGLNNRLFLTGALRMDGASNFGQKYEAVVYPKMNVSWMLGEEPFLPKLPALSQLRVRYAFGVSGQQAYSWMARPTFVALTPSPPPVIEGKTSPFLDVTALGNPNLRPERSQEHEFGLEAGWFDNRVQLSLTWFRRRAVDQIVSLTLPYGLGTMSKNLALTTGSGFEVGLNLSVIDTRAVSVDLNLGHGTGNTKLVDGDDDVLRALGYRKGYPLGGPRFDKVLLGYNDADGNGIITYGELQLSEERYLGLSTPPGSQSLGINVGLFNRRLRLMASFNRSAGNMLQPINTCGDEQCLALLDPATPLAEQAQALASRYAFVGVKADFIRLREVSLSTSLPERVLKRVGISSGAISVGVRNVAEWTSFPNGDPDALRYYNTGSAGGYGGGSNIPQTRSWDFRLDLGL